MESVWRIYELMDTYKKEHIDIWIEEKIRNIIEEKKEKEINDLLEYNYFILDEMIEFINDVSHCKDMMSINIAWSEISDNYIKIIKFLHKNNKYIKELWVNDQMLILANNMFIYYLKWNFNSLNWFESVVKNSFMEQWFPIEFTEDFYDEMKKSLISFIEILNRDILYKKNSLK